MTKPDLPRASVYIATSLDGFIARTDGSIDWLPPMSAEEDYGYGDFIATVDTMVLGRKSFEKVLTFGSWPYPDHLRIVVLSSGTPTVPDELAQVVEVMDLEPVECLRQLGATGTRHVYVDGGVTIQRFLRAGVIQNITVTTVPVLIGSGLCLFGELANDITLTHLETTAYPDGLVQSRYRVATPESMS